MSDVYSPEKVKELLSKIRRNDIVTYRDYIEQIFLTRIKKTRKCWMWIGGKTVSGYGSVKIKGTNDMAHRLSYELYNGKIPANMMVCHTCDTPSCVNPKHLWIGTRSDNMKDAFIKGRINKHSLIPFKNGEEHPNSKLTVKDVIFIIENHKIMKSKELSKKFDVHIKTIQKIWRRDAWKHLN